MTGFYAPPPVINPNIKSMSANRWNDEFLNRMRQTGDAEADQLLNNLVAKGANAEASRQLFRSLITNRDPVPADAPAEVKAYFDATQAMPPWADHDLIRKGTALFNLHGSMFVLALFCKALPECYAGANGAQVLYSSGRLTQKPGQMDAFQRRIAETAQFTIDVMAEGGLTRADGQGIRTVQKIRLIHASIRHYIKIRPSWLTALRGAKGEPPLPWDDEKLGVPINQEDLAGTLLAFSSVTLDGAAKMGLPLTHEEEEAYYHTWRVVGYILGINEEMLPDNVADARALWAAIDRRQFGPSLEGQALTRSLVDFMKYALHSRLFSGLPEAIMYLLMGKRVSNYLRVRGFWHYRAVASLLGDVLGVILPVTRLAKSRYSLLNPIMRKVSHQLMQALIISWNDDKKIQFSIPPGLQENWKLDPAKKRQP